MTMNARPPPFSGNPRAGLSSIRVHPEGPRMLQSPRPDLADARPGFREFVALIAGLMALNALAIDAMVPALPAIGRSLHILTENERQLVVSFYMFGFGTTQILYGPLSDRYGRKPVLVVSLVLYVAF